MISLLIVDDHPVVRNGLRGIFAGDPDFEVLGEAASISSDFGGNPPYEKMKQVARICYTHFLAQSNVLFIIGGKSNNTDIFETFRAMADALREYISEHGPTPLHVVIGRGGPNLVRGMGAMRDTMDALGISYRIFGFDSDINEVVNYAESVNEWMKTGGREQIARKCMGHSDITA